MVALAPGPVSRVSVMDDLEVKRKVRAVTHRPKECIGIVGVNVIVDGNDKLAARAQQSRRTVERPPHFCVGGVALDNHGNDFP